MKNSNRTGHAGEDVPSSAVQDPGATSVLSLLSIVEVGTQHDRPSKFQGRRSDSPFVESVDGIQPWEHPVAGSSTLLRSPSVPPGPWTPVEPIPLPTGIGRLPAVTLRAMIATWTRGVTVTIEQGAIVVGLPPAASDDERYILEGRTTEILRYEREILRLHQGLLPEHEYLAAFGASWTVRALADLGGELRTAPGDVLEVRAPKPIPGRTWRRLQLYRTRILAASDRTLADRIPDMETVYLRLARMEDRACRPGAQSDPERMALLIEQGLHPLEAEWLATASGSRAD